MNDHTAYAILRSSVAALTVALQERDAYTRDHCDRVVVITRDLGSACGVTNGELDLLRLGAMFHDIGKIGIPDTVLLKPGRLDAEEWALMQAHAEKGERIIRSTALKIGEQVAPIIRHHHEAYDGSGYPDGLSGEAIPLLSRIIMICDAYDAMATTRPYHTPRSHRQVMDVLVAENANRLDPSVFQTFTRIIEQSSARVH